jgi:hypothetical protein
MWVDGLGVRDGEERGEGLEGDAEPLRELAALDARRLEVERELVRGREVRRPFVSTVHAGDATGGEAK